MKNKDIKAVFIELIDDMVEFRKNMNYKTKYLAIYQDSCNFEIKPYELYDYYCELNMEYSRWWNDRRVETGNVYLHVGFAVDIDNSIFKFTETWQDFYLDKYYTYTLGYAIYNLKDYIDEVIKFVSKHYEIDKSILNKLQELAKDEEKKNEQK